MKPVTLLLVLAGAGVAGYLIWREISQLKSQVATLTTPSTGSLASGVSSPGTLVGGGGLTPANL